MSDLMPLLLWGLLMLIGGVCLGYLIDKWESKYRWNHRMQLSEKFVDEMEKRQREKEKR